jgi:hypothetical protein
MTDDGVGQVLPQVKPPLEPMTKEERSEILEKRKNFEKRMVLKKL